MLQIRATQLNNNLYGLGPVVFLPKNFFIYIIENFEVCYGVTRKDKIRNEYIRGLVKVERLRMMVREGRLRWYGHIMRRDQEYLGRRVMEM